MCARCPYERDEERVCLEIIWLWHTKKHKVKIYNAHSAKFSKHTGNLKQHQLQMGCNDNSSRENELGKKNAMKYATETQYGD